MKRLALKRANAPSRRMKNKYVPRQTKRAAHNLRNMGRKPYDKKMRRLSVQSKYKKPVSHEQTSDSEVPQKSKKRRTQSYTATSSYRSFRRKAKTPLSSASNTSTRAADKSDSSSDYDDDDGFGDARNGNLPSTSTGILDVNIPSTSTGITANGKGYLFRIASAVNDSDDDQSIPDTSQPSADNLLRVLRSPPIRNNHNNHRAHHNDTQLNEVAGSSGSNRNSFFNTASSSTVRHEVPPNGRRKHQAQEDDSSSCQVEDYASTNSNSLMSSTEESSNDSYPDYYGKKRRIESPIVEDDENGNDSINNINNNSSSFNNNNSFNAVNNNFATTNGLFDTPSNRLRLTPDSGVSSSLPTPSPSCSKSAGPSNGNQIKKIDSIKRNFRKNNILNQTSDDEDDSD